jgi:hypothetical protein
VSLNAQVSTNSWNFLNRGEKPVGSSFGSKIASQMNLGAKNAVFQAQKAVGRVGLEPTTRL